MPPVPTDRQRLPEELHHGLGHLVDWQHAIHDTQLNGRFRHAEHHAAVLILRQHHAAGGVVMAQDEPSCVVFGMPKAAIQLGVVDRVLPVDQMAEAAMQLLWQPLPVRRNRHR